MYLHLTPATSLSIWDLTHSARKQIDAEMPLALITHGKVWDLSLEISDVWGKKIYKWNKVIKKQRKKQANNNKKNPWEILHLFCI